MYHGLGYIEIIKLQKAFGIKSSCFEQYMINRLCEKVSPKIKKLIPALRGINAIISGSFVLELLYPNFHANDIDIFVLNDDFKKLVSEFNFACEFNSVSGHTRYSRIITNKHIKIYNMLGGKYSDIQLIRVNCDPREFINANFDTELLVNYIQLKSPGGYKLFIKNLPSVIARRSSIVSTSLVVALFYNDYEENTDDMAPRVFGDLLLEKTATPGDIEYMIGLSNRIRNERVEKYASRGVTFIPKNISFPEWESQFINIMQLLRVKEYDNNLVHKESECCAIRNGVIRTPGSHKFSGKYENGIKKNCCYCNHYICDGSHCA